MKRAGHLELVAASAVGVALIAAASEIPLVNGAPARRVKLLPIGAIAMRDGRGPYRIRDRAHAEQVVAATRTWLGTADLMFDYDHQALYAPKPGVGGKAIASGWVKPASLSVEDDGIYAEVDWTAAATAALTAREYRYVSPTFLAAKDGGDVIQLKNAALVNIGAIDLPAVAAALDDPSANTGDSMELTALAALLGLGADATAEQVAAAIGELKKPGVPANIAVAAGLAETATVEEVAAAIGAMKSGAAPDPTKFVPIEQLSQVNARVAVLEGDRAQSVVAAAIQSGKLAPAAKAWGIDYFKKDPDGFNTMLGVSPTIVAAGEQLGERKPGEKFTALTADEVAACAAIGRSHEDFLKAKNEEIA
ncbi:hypothetical protein DBR17_17800 [Sphingomonas sp. HMWF008]|nr:hypothetical protein DBR17_17800 [Sphingomonas sp. HMWF008]